MKHIFPTLETFSENGCVFEPKCEGCARNHQTLSWVEILCREDVGFFQSRYLFQTRVLTYVVIEILKSHEKTDQSFFTSGVSVRVVLRAGTAIGATCVRECCFNGVDLHM